MLVFFSLRPVLVVFILGLSPCTSNLNEGRKALYRSNSIQHHCSTRKIVTDNDGRDVLLPLWPLINEDLPNGSLDRAIGRLVNATVTSGDYELGQVVRVLFLSQDTDLQTDIIKKLQAIYDSQELRLWLTIGERHNVYWREPDMILWLSSAWLLQSALQFRPDDGAVSLLESRLLHFLETKLTYGFYEFFSPTYSQGTLAALLNLFDFAPETRIRELAGKVISRLLEELLLFPTDQGYYFTVTGGGFVTDYLSPKYSSIVWFLTGTEAFAFEPDYVGSFLATSSFGVEQVGSGWEASISKKIFVGHPVSQLGTIHSKLALADRVLFQWSAGALIYSEVVEDTFTVIDAYDLEENAFWTGNEFMFTSFFRQHLSEISQLLSGLARGSDRSGANVAIYRHEGVILSSLERYNAQYRSHEQWVWVAAVDDVAVWTQSGVTGEGFDKRGDKVINTHMPLIQQKDNVALISYLPSKDIRESPLLKIFLPKLETQVALHFPVERFDEVEESGNWIIGRKGDGYVGVWRHGLGKTRCPEDSFSCTEYFFSDPTNELRSQVWAAVVGNSMTHGDFANFRNIVSKGSVTEQYSGILSWIFGWGYRTELSVDGRSIVSEL